MTTEDLMQQAVQAHNDSMGWCSECKEWTRPMTEPDANDYECPDCEQHTVIGADWRLFELDAA